AHDAERHFAERADLERIAGVRHHARLEAGARGEAERRRLKRRARDRLRVRELEARFGAGAEPEAIAEAMLGEHAKRRREALEAEVEAEPRGPRRLVVV